MRLSVFDGINRQSITHVLVVLVYSLTRLKNTRYAVKQSRVSFFNLIILSPYRWLVKRLAQLQFTRLLDQINARIERESFPSGAFSFSFLLGVFFSLSFKLVNPLRSDDQGINDN